MHEQNEKFKEIDVLKTNPRVEKHNDWMEEFNKGSINDLENRTLDIVQSEKKKGKKERERKKRKEKIKDNLRTYGTQWKETIFIVHGSFRKKRERHRKYIYSSKGWKLPKSGD